MNVGPTRKVLSGLRPMVEELAQSSGQPVALVGWSLGGVFARLVARQVPDWFPKSSRWDRRSAIAIGNLRGALT